MLKRNLPLVLFIFLAVGVVGWFKNIPHMLPPPYPTGESRPALLELYSVCRFRNSIKVLMQCVFICTLPFHKLKGEWDNMQIIKLQCLMRWWLHWSVWSHLSNCFLLNRNDEEDAEFPHPLVFYLLSDSGGHSAQMTTYSDSGYQDSSVSYYSNKNVVRSEPRASLSRSPRAEGQASGQVGLTSTGLFEL